MLFRVCGDCKNIFCHGHPPSHATRLQHALGPGQKGRHHAELVERVTLATVELEAPGLATMAWAMPGLETIEPVVT